MQPAGVRHEVAEVEVAEVGNEVVVLTVESHLSVYVHRQVAHLSVDIGIHAVAVVRRVAGEVDARWQVIFFLHVGREEALDEVGVADFGVEGGGERHIV